LVTQVFAEQGFTYTQCDMSQIDAFIQAFTPNTRLIWLETPSNPLLKIMDIKAIAQLKQQALLCVDNTFATPYLQNPLALGADIVCHSTTKYAGGHSDVVGGAVVVAPGVEAPWMDGIGNVGAGVVDRIAFHQNAMGVVPSPFDAFLVHR